MKENPDHFKKKYETWRKVMLAKDPNYFKKKYKDWRKRMSAKNPNYFKEKNQAWRKAMLAKNPNYFKEKNQAWRKEMLAKNPNYFKEQAKNYKHLTLLRTKKHLQDYFEEIKKEAEKKNNKTSKRSIDDLSHVFQYALHHDSLLTKGLEEQLQVRQLKDSAYNRCSAGTDC